MRAMVSRRKFLGMLAALPAITALAGSGLLLPRRRDIEVEAGQYFASKDTWYIKMDAQEAQEFRYFNRVSSQADLNQESLEDMLKQMQQFIEHPPPFALKPAKLIVHPDMLERAQYVLTHRPTLLERFLWRLFPVD